MTPDLFKRPSDDVRIQLLRYFVVGGTAFAVDFGLLWLLTESAGLHYVLSAALAFTAGLTVNYALSVIWVFNRHALRSRAAEFALFAVIGVVGLGLNEAILWGLTEWAGVHYLASKTVAAAVVFAWNFTARKYMLFNGGSK